MVWFPSGNAASLWNHHRSITRYWHRFLAGDLPNLRNKTLVSWAALEPATPRWALQLAEDTNRQIVNSTGIHDLGRNKFYSAL